MTTTADTITITIDGAAVECRPGELLIEVAKRAGVYIPYFCYHPRMDPVGACRMCLVKVEPGPPKPQTACTMRVGDGMVVETQFANPDIQQAQRSILELLLINHPLDCPICDRGGECPLQDQAQDYGPSETRYVEPKRRFDKAVEISPLVTLDRERCILCYRCTRFCEEVSGDTLIAVMERGPSAYIYPFEGEAFDSYFSGNTIQICPVGALTSSQYRFQARPWDLQTHRSTCNLCAAGCSVNVNVRVADGNVIRFSGATNEDTNEEWLCDKGRWGHAYISSPGRLTQPKVRRDGTMVAVSWDEAFRELGKALGPLIESGRSATRTGLLAGASLCDEDLYTAQKFARLVLATNSIDHRLEGGMKAEALLTPSVDYERLLGSDLVVLVSVDLREELPVTFLRLRVAATKRGLRIAVVGARRDAAAELAAVRVPAFPASDALVGGAVAAALGQPVAAGVEALAAAAGVAGDDVRRLAEALRSAQRPTILLGPQSVSDPEAVRAWRAVAATAGASLGWAPRRANSYGAMAVGAHPDLLPGWRRLSDTDARAVVGEAWGCEVPEAPGMGSARLLARAAEGDIDALWLVGADVVEDVPDVRLGAEAARSARFTIVSDLQDSELTEIADLVLPAAAFTERDGTITDWEGRRQQTSQVNDPPGAARADYAILAEAARRLGRPIGCRSIADVRAELATLLQPPAGPEARPATVHAARRQDDAEFGLRLLSYRLLYDAGSRVRHSEGIGELTPAVFCEINPGDAAAAGVADGSAIRVRSRHGSLTATARVTDVIRRGVVFVPYNQSGGSARALMRIDDHAPGVRVEPA